MKCYFIIISLTIFWSISVPAGIIHVPQDQPSIQAGINSALNGDTVLVADSTYYENINFRGKAITVGSHFIMDDDTNHINNTIIDGSQPVNPDSGSVVSFISGEDTTSVLCGFTITNGSGTYYSAVGGFGGGGVYMLSGGKIINNKITYNIIESPNVSAGAGLLVIAANDINIIIAHNEFKYNSILSQRLGTGSGGGGIYCKWLPPNGYLRICDNLISHNTVTVTSVYKAIAGGIGISMDLPCAVDAIIENNIISYNKLHCIAGIGGGIYVVYWDPGYTFIDNNPSPVICNNIISHNYSEDKGGGVGIWTVETAPIWPRPGSIIKPQPAIINNTIVNNSANDGCGIFNFDSFPLLLNNILWDDLSIPGSREIFNGDITYPNYPDHINDGDIELYHSIIQGSEWSDINRAIFDIEPLFSDTLYHLSAASPCVGIGRSSIMVDNSLYSAPPFDFEGNPRPFGVDTMIDVGAYESNHPCILVHPTSFYSSGDKPYLNPTTDSILITADVFNPLTHNIDIYAKIESVDKTDVDSTLMYDDGLHHDGAANDGLYGGTMPPLQVENEFDKLIVSVHDQQTGTHHNFYNSICFTTIGAIVFEGYQIQSVIPWSAGYRTYLTISVRNTGATRTAEQIEVEIVTDDSTVVNIINAHQNFGDIPGGQIVTSPFTSSFIKNTKPLTDTVLFKLNIYSHGVLFWQDSTMSVIVGLEKSVSNLPKEYALHTNYPNPFNPSTSIEFDLPKTTEVTLKVFNILGEEVTTLVSDRLSAGSYSYEWDASNLASGVYLYRLQAVDYVETRKMILMK